MEAADVCYRLPSVEYEPQGEESLFEKWESGAPAETQPPLSVCDAAYRHRIVLALAPYLDPNARDLVSVGSGNGLIEAELSRAGWCVLATDVAESALRLCRSRGLPTARFSLMDDLGVGQTFDATYCDGVMGHLWQPGSRCRAAWVGLAQLGRPGAVGLVANDLADCDDRPDFAVRSSPRARYYRPPAGVMLMDAVSTGLWALESEGIYRYRRAGTMRRREVLVMRLLVDEWIEPKDRP